jgi:hypothetical protein
MKTVIATIALSLISAVSFAKTVDSVNSQAAYQARTGAGPESYTPFMSTRSRAEVIAELKATPRLPGYVDGSAHEMAIEMFMSRRTRAEVRTEAASFDRFSGAGLPDIQGGRN